ncbi:hypothetical protein BH23ACT9_BH23ACT9_18000 [soil metagenome]
MPRFAFALPNQAILADAHSAFLTDASIREEWIWLQQQRKDTPALLLVHWIGDDLTVSWERLTHVGTAIPRGRWDIIERACMPEVVVRDPHRGQSSPRWPGRSPRFDWCPTGPATDRRSGRRRPARCARRLWR